ncbi:MAG: hypothetical protein OES79_13320, partial [Planctomycetota bacterium]|nr:hypothetical protein [Planctomycetota bacterium]
LPAGATTASATVPLPQFQPFHTLSWTVTVNGVAAPELNAVPFPGPSSARGGYNEAEPRVLKVTGKRAAGNQRQSTPVPDPRDARRSRWNSPKFTAVDSTPHLIELSRAELPSSWLGYTSLDSVFISAKTLKLLAEASPGSSKKMQALRRWVATGGNLYVHDVGNNWGALGELETAFGLPVEPTGPPAERGWRADHDQQTQSMMQQAAATPVDVQATKSFDRVVLNPQQQQPLLQKFSTKFLWRDYRLGCLVAMAGSLPADFQPGVPREVPAPPRQYWSIRHGVSFDQGSQDFWTMLIPDVGLAPIGEFRILITLFVIAIGPVNYFLLRRMGKLHVLLITVPVGAAFVTAGLFLYAVVSDGFDTRVRVRSFTEIDQRTGEAVCWSRQSYYAGMAPPQGLQMPDDVVVYPIGYPHRYYYRNEQSNPRDIVWNQDQQLTRGWLNSRTPTQYLVIGARTTDKGLKFQKAPAGIRVRNQLQTPIHHVLVSDDKGELFWGDSITQAGSATLSPITWKTAQQKVRKIFQENWPRIPDELQQSGGAFSLSQEPYWETWGQSGGYWYYGFQSSRLEHAMHRWLAPKTPPAPRSYLAIVARSPEVRLGKEKVTESDSFHVILGHW